METHRQGVLDPMSAVLMAVSAETKPLSAEACNRTLPIFDGRGRFDLVLGYKRSEQVKALDGYHGPVDLPSYARSGTVPSPATDRVWLPSNIWWRRATSRCGSYPFPARKS
jgi:hypothetical protein